MAVYLVTGGAGFIGSHLVEALLARGEAVRVIDNFSTGKRANLSHLRGNLEVEALSITDYEALHRVMNGVEYVLHKAALPSVQASIDDPLLSHLHTGTGTLNVLRAAQLAGVRRVIYAGSASIFGNLPGEYTYEDSPAYPLSPYAVDKLMGEHYCRIFTRNYGLETVTLRYFNVFGPRQDPTSEYSAVIPRFITAMIDDSAPTVYGDGEQSRDFTFVADIVQANLLACDAPTERVSGEAFNIACGERTSLLELVTLINGLLEKQITPHFVPARAGEVRHSRADIRKAQDRLGYQPCVPLREGLRQAVEWFKVRA
jgi:nucleoside-diphosphate-sugar epimerase